MKDSRELIAGIKAKSLIGWVSFKVVVEFCCFLKTALLGPAVDALAAEGAVGGLVCPWPQLMAAVRALVIQKMRNQPRERDDYADP